MSVTASHEILAPAESPLSVDWNAIDRMPDREAADALRGILGAAEGLLGEAEHRLTVIRDRIFNVRMICFRIMETRELWKLEVDPEYGIPYKSMYRWLQVAYPNDEGLRYAMEANATKKALPAATLEDLGQIKRCNAITLASKFVSDTCRRDPKVLKAAKTASENGFREKLNKDHGQHLEAVWTLKLSGPESGGKKIEAALDEIGERENVTDRFGQLEALVADWQQGGHSGEYEA